MELKTFIVLLLALPACAAAMAQPCDGVITGRVVQEDGRPLAGAVIFLVSEERGTTSDSTGNFVLKSICAGEHSLRIQSLGQESREMTLNYPSDGHMVIRLKPDVRELGEIVIQEQKLETEHSHNTSTLGEKELSEAAGKSLGESLKDLPGVSTIQSGPGIFKPVIHGVHSQRVLILNHGIRQEGQQWGAEHAPEIDPFIASDITVIKDASSIKYGTDALGGVVVVNPPVLPESNVLGGTFQTVLQSNGRSGTASGMLEGGIRGHDGWGWRIQGTGKRAGDFHAPDYNLTNTGVKEVNYSAAAGYHHEQGGVEIFFSHFSTSLGILKGASISTLGELIAAMENEPPRYTENFSYSINEPRQEVSHNLVKVNGHVKTKKGDLRMQYGFQNNHRKEFDIRKGSLSGIPSINLQLNSHTLETEFETSRSGKRSLCVGLTGMIQDNRNIPGTRRIAFIPNFVSLSGGAFGIWKLFLNRWVVDLGGRYDYRDYQASGFDFKNSLYRSNFSFHNASATAGATFLPENESVFSSNLSSAWRPPHVAELYSIGTHQSAAAIEFGLLLNDSTNEVMDIEDVSFDVEQAVKWVNTYEKKWARFRAQVTAYGNYIFNYIYLKPAGVTETLRGVFPALRYTQTDALFLGVDLSGDWQVHPAVRISPKATMLRASDARNDDYLVFIPSNRFETTVRFEKPEGLGVKKWYAESKVKYTARQHRAPRVVTIREIADARQQNGDPLEDNRNFDFARAPDGYWLWNVSAGFSVPAKEARIDFRASAENVLNTSYREYSNRFRYYADDLGRNLIVSVKCIF